MKYIETEKRDNRRIHRRIMRWPLAFWIGAAFLLGVSQLSFGAARIWDNDTSSWTTTFANGDPIDTGTANDAFYPQVVVDSNDIVYFTYYQSFTGRDHIYLSRYDGTDVRIWDKGVPEWTDNFANGDPIDTGTANDASNP
ncbi:MAG: hypothetical protein KAV87_41680, partial [Desulfobacteraceae bacterium]|nr:hypothetical protein [Desulfobacteraceae bacterium]